MENEAVLRLSVFIGILVAMMAWEFMAPRRSRSIARWVRWPNNLAISLVNSTLLRLVAPAAVVGFAAVAEARGWGVLNTVAWPGWLEIALAVILLDLAIYLQHVMVHAVPLLWRLHRMHHADLDFDVTTAIRFHPFEILLSAGIRAGVVAALGASPLSVLIFELILNGTAMFNHGNVRIPPGLDRVLRLIVVTPDMHRVHHSIVVGETNSNFGFSLPWWDRLFGTYRAQPAAGHDGMTIGIDDFRAPRELWLDRLLIQPFHGRTGNYPINRRD